jgi:crotonobetainyl-CoA:carnitine CoA-transferase CaiB-like acyl-CoA transferase
MEKALNAAGVPSARVRDLGEYLSDLYPQTPGIGVRGEGLAFGPAFRWDQGEHAALSRAPRLGADTDELLSMV